jgi:hypothetical protein
LIQQATNPNPNPKYIKTQKIFGHEIAKGPLTMGKIGLLKQKSLNKVPRSTATKHEQSPQPTEAQQPFGAHQTTTPATLK